MEDVDKILISLLKEDAFDRDVTTALLPETECEAEIKANEECILAGVEEVTRLFKLQGVKTTYSKKDGDSCKKGEVVMRIKGLNTSILPVERTALNLIGRMSGVATISRKAVDIASKYGVKIALTRKTVPGLRYFDKKAAKIAGAWPHRHDLSEMVLIKDNHLVFCESIEKIVKNAKKTHLKVEVEVESIDQALEAAKSGADIIMLDNFPTVKAAEAVEKLREYPVKIELSGGINFENLEAYVRLKPDIVSMGCLTKDAKMIDFSLEIVR